MRPERREPRPGLAAAPPPALSTRYYVTSAARVIRAELRRELEAPRHLVHDDDRRRAHVLRNGRGLHTEAPRALDDHARAEAEARLVQTEEHLRERAVHGRHHLVGERVGDLEDV